MAKRVGVVLSGCGVFDGSEIHESVIAILALDRAGAEIHYFAPNIEHQVKNHLTGEMTDEKRSVLVEAARISRGEKVTDLAEAKAQNLDALVFPGGFGAALNLSDFATKGSECEVHTEVERIIKEFIDAKKPIGAMCIAPATLARVLGKLGVKSTVTLGTDDGIGQKVEAMGVHHEKATVDAIVIDEANKIVTTPAYMLGPSIKDVAQGIEKLVPAVLALA